MDGCSAKRLLRSLFSLEQRHLCLGFTLYFRITQASYKINLARDASIVGVPTKCGVQVARGVAPYCRAAENRDAAGAYVVIGREGKEDGTRQSK